MIAGSCRAPAFVLKKDVATPADAAGVESRWIAIEVNIINGTPKIVISANLPQMRLPLEQFTATRLEFEAILGSFLKHQALMVMDANTRLTGHSDGFRVGYAVPNSDKTANDKVRTTYFVNFVTKNGLVAQNTWSTARAPQEVMYTRKEWDKHRIMDILAVGTKVDYVSTTETANAKSCEIEDVNGVHFLCGSRHLLTFTWSTAIFSAI